MKTSNIFSLSREKYLLSYTLKGFSQNLKNLNNSHGNPGVYLTPAFEYSAHETSVSTSNQDEVGYFYLSGNEDQYVWLLNNFRKVEEILSKFSRLVFCISPHQFKELSSFLNKGNLGAARHEYQIVLDAVITDNDSETQLPGQTISLIKEAIMLSSKIANSYFTFKTTEENCFWADDINNLFVDKKQSSIFFYPSGKFFLRGNSGDIKIRRETFFHHLMFYDNLARQKSVSLANRLFYKRIIGLLKGSTEYSACFKNKIPGLQIKNLGNDLTALNFPLNKYGSRLDEDLLFADFENLFLPRFPELFKLTFNLVKGKLGKSFIGNASYKIQTNHPSIPREINPESWKHVLITGWYGTETNGDKAIIGEILHFIKACSPACKISLTTIYPLISIQTNFELRDLEGVELISIYEKDFAECIRNVDAVIMGGGPIMETVEMINVLRLFEEANNQNKARIIFGCGIGPFHSQKIIDVTKRVLALTTAGFVRDQESWEYASRLYPGHVLKFACDPAIAFIYRWKKKYFEKMGKFPPRAKKILCLLRANTNEFAADQSVVRLEEINRAYAKQIGDFLQPVCNDLGYQASLLHMNAPWIGGDDRLFNRFVEERFADSKYVKNERRYLELDDLIERMLGTEVALVMRYHGHIFCLALGIPFVSIDYTGKKGKVSSLVNRIGYAQWSVEWSGIQSESVTDQVKSIVTQREEISLFLNQETEKLVALLCQTYKEVFNVNLQY